MGAGYEEACEMEEQTSVTCEQPSDRGTLFTFHASQSLGALRLDRALERTKQLVATCTQQLLT